MKVKIGPYPKGNKERKIEVKIDNYDIWSADYTLALIIHPLLVKFRKNLNGGPNVEDEHVPEELKSTSAPPKKNEWDIDANWFKRWEYVLDEMIWSFEAIIHEWDESPDQYEKDEYGEYKFHKTNARIQNGLMLFGKYYRGLWN